MSKHDVFISYSSKRDNTENSYHFKALCEIDGRLCVVQSLQPISFYDFVSQCSKIGAEEAIYLDLDENWHCSWYREPSGKIHGHAHYDSTYCSNWITFYK